MTSNSGEVICPVSAPESMGIKHKPKCQHSLYLRSNIRVSKEMDGLSLQRRKTTTCYSETPKNKKIWWLSLKLNKPM